MKRSSVILSALLILVMLLGQVVCVNAKVTTTYSPTLSTTLRRDGLIVDVDSIQGATAYKIYVNGTSYNDRRATVALDKLNSSNSVYCIVTVDGKNYTSAVSTVSTSQPTISCSVAQTDHFKKTVTASAKGGVGVKTIRIDGYKKVNADTQNTSYTTGEIQVNGADMSVSLEIAPEVVKSVKITVVDMLDRKITKVVNTGDNGYYSPSSSKESSGVWDGIRENKSSVSENTNVWTGYYTSTERVDAEEEKQTDYSIYYVTCRKLNVRKSDSTRGTKVGTLTRNTAVRVYNIQDGWAVIDYKGDLRYVSARYLSR